jgi:hypothetical protein
VKTTYVRRATPSVTSQIQWSLGRSALGILHSEVANDRLEINTLAGTDTVDSVGLAAGAVQLFVDGMLVP